LHYTWPEYLESGEKMKTLKNWLLSFVIAFALFYLMDHSMMSMQGLPLNINMTPAQ